MSKKEFIEWKEKHTDQYIRQEADILKKVKHDYCFKNEIDFLTFVQGYFSVYYENLIFNLLSINLEPVPDYTMVKRDLNNYFNL